MSLERQGDGIAALDIACILRVGVGRQREGSHWVHQGGGEDGMCQACGALTVPKIGRDGVVRGELNDTCKVRAASTGGSAVVAPRFTYWVQ